jgi:hypothetical protein
VTGHVWYAAYGSNLAAGRFDCYLSGGTPRGAAREYVGARDGSPASGDSWLWCDHELYFARQSRTWGGGVAFLNPVTGSGSSLLRVRRLTCEQFEDVMAQENALLPGDVRLAEPPSNGEAVAVLDRWYGTVLGLGERPSSSGVSEPVLSFTHSELGAETRPQAAYLATMLSGLRSSGVPVDPAEYLGGLRGIRGHWDLHELRALADSTDAGFN